MKQIRKDIGREKQQYKEKTSDEKFKLVDIFYKASPFTKSITKNHELEVKFGTRGYKCTK